MKRLSPLLYCLLLLILAAGCIPDPLPVQDIPRLKTKLVVSSQIIPDQSLAVMVTKSIGALDAGRGSDLPALIGQIIVEDAIVVVQYDDRRDTLQYLGTGVYGGTNINLQAGKSYTLLVNSPTFGEVSATTLAPRQVPFKSVEAKLFKTGYDSLAQVNYSLTDPAERNWYMVNVQKFSRKQQVNNFLNPRVFTRLVKDDDFNGQEFREEFKVFFQNYSKGDTVAVFLSSISQEYFDFLSLRNDSRYTIAGFASEPLNYSSNVEGGYGYFNLHIPDVRIFVME